MDKNQDTSEFCKQRGQSDSVKNEDNEDMNMRVDEGILSNSGSGEISVLQQEPEDILKEPIKKVVEVSDTSPQSSTNISNQSQKDVVAESNSEDNLEIDPLLEDSEDSNFKESKQVPEIETAPHSSINTSNRSPKDLVARTNTEEDPKFSKPPQQPEKTVYYKVGRVSWQSSNSSADPPPEVIKSFLQQANSYVSIFTRHLQRERVSPQNTNINPTGQLRSNLAALSITGNNPERSDPQQSYEEINEVLQINEVSENSDINPIGQSPTDLVALSNTDNNHEDLDLRQEIEENTREGLIGELTEINKDAQK